jgi:hypothetical protein
VVVGLVDAADPGLVQLVLTESAGELATLGQSRLDLGLLRWGQTSVALGPLVPSVFPLDRVQGLPPPPSAEFSSYRCAT